MYSVRRSLSVLGTRMVFPMLGSVTCALCTALSTMSHVGAASVVYQRGATAWESEPGSCQPLDLQCAQQYANANAILTLTTETALSTDRPQWTFLGCASAEVPLSLSPCSAPMRLSIGDCHQLDANAHDDLGRHFPPPSSRHGPMISLVLLPLPGQPPDESNLNRRSDRDKPAPAFAGLAVDDEDGPHRCRPRAAPTTRDPAVPGGDAFIIDASITSPTHCPPCHLVTVASATDTACIPGDDTAPLPPKAVEVGGSRARGPGAYRCAARALCFAIAPAGDRTRVPGFYPDGRE